MPLSPLTTLNLTDSDGIRTKDISIHLDPRLFQFPTGTESPISSGKIPMGYSSPCSGRGDSVAESDSVVGDIAETVGDGEPYIRQLIRANATARTADHEGEAGYAIDRQLLGCAKVQSAIHDEDGDCLEVRSAIEGSATAAWICEDLIAIPVAPDFFFVIPVALDLFFAISSLFSITQYMK
ncbi:unnamed protein product [Cuscuta campestris]|uniref:Uncharacterized protein n=1 Tax=Cuscuta campestris TaxID=132261 RepID=A0A484NPA9_9ASTE|nr:unnamed protein product [Cuscuta campestris]